MKSYRHGVHINQDEACSETQGRPEWRSISETARWGGGNTSKTLTSLSVCFCSSPFPVGVVGFSEANFPPLLLCHTVFPLPTFPDFMEEETALPSKGKPEGERPRWVFPDGRRSRGHAVSTPPTRSAPQPSLRVVLACAYEEIKDEVVWKLALKQNLRYTLMFWGDSQSRRACFLTGLRRLSATTLTSTSSLIPQGMCSMLSLPSLTAGPNTPGSPNSCWSQSA